MPRTFTDFLLCQTVKICCSVLFFMHHCTTFYIFKWRVLIVNCPLKFRPFRSANKMRQQKLVESFEVEPLWSPTSPTYSSSLHPPLQSLQENTYTPSRSGNMDSETAMPGEEEAWINKTGEKLFIFLRFSFFKLKLKHMLQ